MKRRRAWIRAACWLLLVTPIVVTSTPPRPAPWHNFLVYGAVESRSGGSVGNYTVVLMGNPRDTWKVLHSCPSAVQDDYGGAQDIAITPANGRFWLDVWSCDRPESIAVAVVLPDTIIMGSRVWRRDYDYQEFWKEYETSDGGLCADDEDVNVIDGYMYHGIDSLVVPVP
jgi:hypothetical protein